MSDELLTVRLERSDGSLVIRLEGEIDLSNAEQLQRQLESASNRCPQVTLDLTNIEYLDSQGLRLVKQICNKTDREGTTLRLVAPPTSVARQVLDLAHMQDYVEILDALGD